MSGYGRTWGEEGNFLGYAFPLQPLIGEAECAVSFPSAGAACASTPAAIHAEMEMLEASVRIKEARHHPVRGLRKGVGRARRRRFDAAVVLMG